jgi:hypothetical protein
MRALRERKRLFVERGRPAAGYEARWKDSLLTVDVESNLCGALL